MEIKKKKDFLSFYSERKFEIIIKWIIYIMFVLWKLIIGLLEKVYKIVCRLEGLVCVYEDWVMLYGNIYEIKDCCIVSWYIIC